jgi:hypothetical protein
MQQQHSRPATHTHNRACAQVSSLSSSSSSSSQGHSIKHINSSSSFRNSNCQLLLQEGQQGPRQQGQAQLQLVKSRAAGLLLSLLQKPRCHSPEASHAQQQELVGEQGQELAGEWQQLAGEQRQQQQLAEEQQSAGV